MAVHAMAHSLNKSACSPCLCVYLNLTNNTINTCFCLKTRPYSIIYRSEFGIDMHHWLQNQKWMYLVDVFFLLYDFCWQYPNITPVCCIRCWNGYLQVKRQRGTSVNKGSSCGTVVIYWLPHQNIRYTSV